MTKRPSVPVAARRPSTGGEGSDGGSHVAGGGSPPLETDLASARIRALLATSRMGRSLDVRAETTSTNDDARVAADAGAPAGHTVVADAQSRGRGSHGRVWSSPPGSDLYFSIVERLVLPPQAIPVLTLAVGLGVARAVEALAPGAEVRVKWPNDVWLDGKKCAGILVESSSTGARVDAFVVGIGLGVNRTEWPPGLSHTATSLRRARADDTAFDRAVVLARVLLEVERAVDELAAAGPAPILAGLEARLALRGASVRVADVAGTLLGLAATGALRIAAPGGSVREVIAGTLRARPPVRLRPWRKNDLDALAAIVADPSTMATVGGPIRTDELAGLLDRHVAPDGADPKWLVLRAAELDGEIVGSGRLSEVLLGDLGAGEPEEERTALELGYLVRSDHAGRGIATEIALGMLAEARARGASRLFARVAESNVASVRVLERAGFANEGERDAAGLMVFVRVLDS